MNNIIRKPAFFILIILAFTYISGCTPGKTMFKSNDNKNRPKHEQIDEYGYEEENSNFNDEMDQKEMRVQSDNKNKKKSERQNNLDYEELDNIYEKDDSNDRERYYQTGLASWYGREFNGKVTASGDKFNMNKYTAAHKTLPFGTIIQIKNFENGKTVQVKINDRGPYRGERIIDVSYGAAKSLGMISSGEVMVGIDIIKKGNNRISGKKYNRGRDNNIEPVGDDNNDIDEGVDGSYSIQAGAFYSKRNAQNLKRKIRDLTENSVVIIRDGDMYKVRVEGLMNKRDAKRFKRILAEEEIDSFVLTDIE